MASGALSATSILDQLNGTSLAGIRLPSGLSRRLASTRRHCGGYGLGGAGARVTGLREHRRRATVVGLYAAAPALIFYALLGSSRHLIVGPMSATAALSAAIIMPLAHGDSARYVALSTALAICTGVAGVLAALLRIVIRRILYLRTSTQGLHCRPGFDDHHWPSAKTARR